MPVLLSIIIPCFKRLDQTKRTIELILQSQGLNDFFKPEIIIADASPDESIKEMVKTLPYSIIYTKPDKTGIACNKNKGASLASNNLLIFCDSDMEVEKETIMITIKSLMKSPRVAMLTGQVIWKKNNSDNELDRPRPEDRIILNGQEKFIEAIYSRYFITYKDVFNQVGGYNEELFNMRGEGSDLSIRYWREGFPLGYDENIKVHHVHDAEIAVTRNIDYPERGIIRDLIQLGYLYGLDREGSTNFAKTLNWLKNQFGDNDKFVVMDSFVNLLPYFWQNQELIKVAKEKVKGIYDFKFLDIFTKEDLFSDCLSKAEDRLKEIRRKTFGL